MAHFAKLDDNNVVLAVHVVNNDVITVDGAESEQAGIDFLTSLYGHSNWKQASYNKIFRKNYPGNGYIYMQDIDAFVPPKPFLTWVVNAETGQWEPPIPYPTDGKKYEWFEPNQQWVEVNN